MAFLIPAALVLASLYSPTRPVSAELHWTVCEPNAEDVLKKFKINNISKKKREVRYFDHKDLKNFDSNLVLRLRRNLKSGKQESNLKLRNMNPQIVDSKWFAVSGFKCESDFFGQGQTTSCSLDYKLENKSFSLNYFSKQQLDFLKSYSSVNPGWEHLLTYGPIHNNVWDFEWKGHELSLEELVVDENFSILEVSTRIDSTGDSETYESLTGEIKKLGVQLCPEQQSKTRQILNYLKP